MTCTTGRSVAKSVYKTPNLIHFGSVRNLTGGSLGLENDGMILMSGSMLLMGLDMGMMGGM